MAKASIQCKEVGEKVVLFLNIWEDEYTGLESLKSVRCALQNDCEFFDRKNLCQSLRKVKKYYESKK